MAKQAPIALVAPLDWGLGHATRCIPIIRELLDMGWQVVVAADRGPGKILQEAFPQLEHVVFPGARIVYPRRGGVVFHFVWQTPGFLQSIYTEQQFIRQWVRENPVDLIISDNRYGVHHDRVPSVLMSHQLRIRVPGIPMAETVVGRFVRYHAARFDAVWVPDWSGDDNLSGSLSDAPGLHPRLRYIGPLSRFASALPADGPLSGKDRALRESLSTFGPFPVLMLISGPEPAVSLFRQTLREQAFAWGEKTLLVEGLPSLPQEVVQEGPVCRVSHLPMAVLAGLLRESGLVVCRSGYSTLMDLAALNKKALLVPTPGQSEQVYLARRFEEKGWAHAVKQSRLDLPVDLAEARSFSGIHSRFDRSALREAIREVSAVGSSPSASS